ncbi:hypothetical protein IFR04_014195 [Cadophora malorum]|uniref:Uncharacterized protein n=1 Tax=Cadophora malorum TaxID=108018 RepID=A0A8H7SZX9_9HELO|nr:hypothetical protein IFR04_014195 [Cadophora malorum]
MLSLLLVIISLFTLTTAQVFTLKTFNPGAPLNGQKIHASGQAFYLGLDGPNTYCPSKVDPNCPSPTDTIVAGALSAMWVEVPGGQQTFVRSEGSIGYTQAHSTSVPAGAHRGGFVNVIVDSDCSEDVNIFTWKAPDGSAEGILACPDVPSYMENIATFIIYVRTPEFNLTDCVELQGLEATIWLNPAPYGAWQYV